MIFTKTKLKDIMTEIWDNASESDREKQEIVSAVLEKYSIRQEDDVPPPPAPKEEEKRVYLVEELKDFQVGTIFIHDELGKCWIESKGVGETQMKFEDPDYTATGFKKDSYPWDMPMRIVHE